MSKPFKRYLVTSALPYANGPVHIGHLAGVYIPSDIYTRYLRLKGYDVISVCGSDEHGVPITIKARKEGVTPQQIVDRYHQLIKSSFEGLGMSFDIYSRTSSKTHAATASEFFRKLYDEGKFIERTSEQYYDEETQTFLADRYIVGTCPRCGNDRAYGDQCEKCGSTLSPDELINPHSAVSGSVPVKRATKHWYLPLDQYEGFLREWILEGHKEWKTNVYGQCKSWLDGGLQPRAVSRDLDWGIPVPVEGAEGKVLYVWFDAPIGYISATKDLTPDWEKYWKDEETKMVHFIGKDNIVFHCIVFPSMLKAHGEYILPENVHIPDGTVPEDRVSEYCASYDHSVRRIDLMIIGVGEDGQIGFNEPGESFDKQVHCVNLTESTIEANKRFFASAEDVPKQAYTMGIKTIMQAKKILIVASGEDKAEIVQKAFFGPITPQVPASVLQLHNDVTLVADEAALSKLSE